VLDSALWQARIGRRSGFVFELFLVRITYYGEQDLGHLRGDVFNREFIKN